MDMYGKEPTAATTQSVRRNYTDTRLCPVNTIFDWINFSTISRESIIPRLDRFHIRLYYSLYWEWWAHHSPRNSTAFSLTMDRSCEESLHKNRSFERELSHRYHGRAQSCSKPWGAILRMNSMSIPFWSSCLPKHGQGLSYLELSKHLSPTTISNYCYLENSSRTTATASASSAMRRMKMSTAQYLSISNAREGKQQGFLVTQPFSLFHPHRRRLPYLGDPYRSLITVSPEI